LELGRVIGWAEVRVHRVSADAKLIS
jgi:hypothetical protein